MSAVDPFADLELSTQVQASEGHLSCDVAGDAAILNTYTGVYYGLDRVGARIWELMAEQTTVEAIRDTLLVEFEVEPDVCEADLLFFLKQLAGYGVIQIGNSRGAAGDSDEEEE